MRSDLWQRRLGWLGVVAVVLSSGALAQTNSMAADEPEAAVADEIELAVDDAVQHVKETVAAAKKQFKAVKEDTLAQAKKEVQAAQEEALKHAAELQDQARRILEENRSFFIENPKRLRIGDTGKLWLGVECREAPPELRAQLGLSDDQGLVVLRVAEDGPGAKAGLKAHDVIVALGDTKLARVPELSKAVDAGEGKEVTLKILRAGKEQTIAVTPADRTAMGTRKIIARPGAGMVLQGGPRIQLPDDVSVTIVRQGSQPARITVSRGDEKWGITDDELEKLPDDLRPHVERSLGGFPGLNVRGLLPGLAPPDAPRIRVEAQKRLRAGEVPRDDAAFAPRPADGPGKGPPDAPRGPQNRRGDGDGDLAQRLEQLDRRLQMLQDEIRGLRDVGPGLRGPGQPGQPPRDGEPRGLDRGGQRRGPQPGEGRQPPRDDRPAPREVDG